jgi:transposase
VHLSGPSRKQRLAEARALYAEGATYAVIAEALGVSPRTVRRWARREREAGRPWQRGGGTESPPRPSAPSRSDEPLSRRLCCKLEERLARLVEQSELADEDARLEDRMLKICRVLDSLRAGDELTARLEAIKRFAAFCVRTLPDEEMTPVRKAIRLFIEELRREHS